ncbi:MAG: YicC/YloC family endoribonuclease [Planctomycetota bacterium]
MPNSMTGFGQASFADDEMSVDVAVRSVNGKHLKTKVRLGLGLPAVEERITALVAKHMRRGTVDVTVRLDWGRAGDMAFNERMMAGYARELEKLRKKLGLSAEISLDRVALLPGAMMAESLSNRAAGRAWRKLEPVVTEAVERALRMRASEGRALTAALKRSCTAGSRLLRRIEARAPKGIEQFRRRLTKRIGILLEDSRAELEPGFLAREVIIYSERSDISEEICRMKAHIAHFTDALKTEGCGRKLEFIAQEMHREANTMASKASDPVTTELIIDLRGEVDKIREQVLNLE